MVVETRVHRFSIYRRPWARSCPKKVDESAFGHARRPPVMIVRAASLHQGNDGRVRDRLQPRFLTI